MTRVKLIGLTGQSGAGKSTAAEMFAESGMTVINADALVAEIYESSPACLRAVAASFGQDIIGTDGRLDRRLLAKRAFESKENTALLGSIVHPFVIAETLKILKTISGTAVFDAPQLFESNMDAVCDIIVSVNRERGRAAEQNPRARQCYRGTGERKDPRSVQRGIFPHTLRLHT